MEHVSRILRISALLCASVAALALAGCGDDEPQPLRTSAAGGDRGTPRAESASATAGRTSPTTPVAPSTPASAATTPTDSATPAAAPPERWIAFTTPSGRFACEFFPNSEQGAKFICDVRPQDGDRGNPQPNVSMPAICKREAPDSWGNGVSIKADGTVEPNCSQGVNVTRVGLPVLAYGRTWERDGISCTSDQAGLTCASAVGGRRFTANREAITVE